MPAPAPIIKRAPQVSVIAGHRALARQMLDEYDNAQRESATAVWESPDILTYNGWLERLWRDCAAQDPLGTPLLLNRPQEEILWQEAIERTLPPGPRPLDISALASAAASAWDLVHHWDLSRQEISMHAPLDDAAAFITWMEAVEKRLEANRWITRSELPRDIATRIRTKKFAAPPEVQYFGMLDLSPATQRLLELCGAIAGMRPAATNASWTRAAFHDAQEELRHAASWAHEQLTRSPKARIGIAVRGIAGKAGVIERIFDDILHPALSFSNSGGPRSFAIAYPAFAAEIPVISSALLVLGLVNGLTLAEAGRLLRSPFLKVDRVRAASADVQLRRDGAQGFSIAFEGLAALFPRLTQESRRWPNGQKTRPSEWTNRFSRLLSAAGWPGHRELTQLEQQHIEHWKDLLSLLAGLDRVLGKITYGEALARLTRIACTTGFSPRIGYVAPIQILDLTDAVGCRFDALWIAGLDHANWPAPARPNPFLPSLLQRVNRLPHSSANEEWAVAQKVMQDLLVAAPTGVVSHACFSAEEPFEPSPLVQSLPGCEETKAGETVTSRIFATPAAMVPAPPDQATPLPAGTAQRGGANLLKKQAECPFQAFARYRLQAREFDEGELGISPVDHGSAAHHCLQVFWQDVRSQAALLSMNETQRNLAMDHAVAAGVAYLLEKHPGTPSWFASVERARLKRILSEWLKFEAKRRPFTVEATELELTIDVSGLRLMTRIDRADRFDNGTVGIVDYKTAKTVSETDWDGDRPAEPQLPLYATASGFPVSEVMFAQLPPEKKQDKLVRGGENLAASLPEWRRVLGNLAHGFLAGDASVDPKDLGKSCKLCRLETLCRVNPSLLQQEEAVDEGGESE